ncbi:MAG TPA: hypothetical protein VIC84_05795 [Blastocatellia bacterium]|jgi:hypothetical protein
MREMDLHPYDGVDRRYRHTDADPSMGLAIVEHILGLPRIPPSEGVLYDLSFYSGGIGVLDRLAIAIPADPGLWAGVITALNAREPEDAANDVVWAGDFRWLIQGAEQLSPIREAAMKFVNSERIPFQEECTPRSRLLFQSDSDVNDWAVIWGTDHHLNYLGYSQG